MLTVNDFLQVERQARKGYTYRYDPINRDNWRSYHEEVLRGEAWGDDCDSLSSTVINLLVLRGHPLEKAWFAHVDSDHDNRGTIDHMIAFAEASDGVLYVVGDTFGMCYNARSMVHSLRKFCKVSNIEAWYEGNDIRQLQLI